MAIDPVLLIKTCAFFFIILWAICIYYVARGQKMIQLAHRNNWFANVAEGLFVAFLAAIVLCVIGYLIFLLFIY